jgi:hypothetical protein
VPHVVAVVAADVVGLRGPAEVPADLEPAEGRLVAGQHVVEDVRVALRAEAPEGVEAEPDVELGGRIGDHAPVADGRQCGALLLYLDVVRQFVLGQPVQVQSGSRADVGFVAEVEVPGEPLLCPSGREGDHDALPDLQPLLFARGLAPEVEGGNEGVDPLALLCDLFQRM